MVESCLHLLSTSSLGALLCALSMLEMVDINLFFYLWKKEFRSIKAWALCLLCQAIKSMCLEEDILVILN